MDSCNVTVKITGDAFQLVFDKQTAMTKAGNGALKNRVPYPKVIQKLLEEHVELLKKVK